MDNESGDFRNNSVHFLRMSAGMPSRRRKRGPYNGDQSVSFRTHFLNPDYERISGTDDSLFPNPHPAEWFIECVNRKILGITALSSTDKYHFGRQSPGKPRHGWISYTNTPSRTPGSSSIIALTRSIPALKIPIPLTSLPSATGQTMGSTPSSRRAKFRRPCSQMIFSTPVLCRFGPAFRITMQYSFVCAILCFISSSVTIVMLSHFPPLVLPQNRRPVHEIPPGLN